MRPPPPSCSCQSTVPSDHLTDTVKGVVPGIQLLWKGASYSTYDRPVPDLVESTLLKQFEDYFNQTQVGGVGLMLDSSRRCA